MLEHAPPPVTVNPDEAQAVFELWVKRRQEVESRNQMPTTKDMAEAMGVPEAEVFALLGEVRAAKRVQPVTAPPVLKPKRRWRVAGFVACFALMTLVFAIANSKRPIYVGPTELRYEGPWPAIGAGRLPNGLSASFRDYAIVGEERGRQDFSDVEETLHDLLGRVVSQQAPQPVMVGNHKLVDSELMMRCFQQDKVLPGAEGFIAFEPILVSMGDQVAKVMMPIALTADPQLEIILQPERERRIRVAANKGARLYSRSLETPKEAPPPDSAIRKE